MTENRINKHRSRSILFAQSTQQKENAQEKKKSLRGLRDRHKRANTCIKRKERVTLNEKVLKEI